LRNEILLNAMSDGTAGKFDNIHTGHPDDHVFIPDCRTGEYNCLHMHWRWGDIPNPRFVSIDPLVDPLTGSTFPESDRGKPYLVPGQTIDIAIVKASSNPSKRDPDDPRTLVTAGEALTVNKGNFENSSSICRIANSMVLKFC
jgi:hypothetical protein